MVFFTSILKYLLYAINKQICKLHYFVTGVNNMPQEGSLRNSGWSQIPYCRRQKLGRDVGKLLAINLYHVFKVGKEMAKLLLAIPCNKLSELGGNCWNLDEQYSSTKLSELKISCWKTVDAHWYQTLWTARVLLRNCWQSLVTSCQTLQGIAGTFTAITCSKIRREPGTNGKLWAITCTKIWKETDGKLLAITCTENKEGTAGKLLNVPCYNWRSLAML